MRARYRVTISPADVGKRITVRARTRALPGQPSATDTVGTLRSWRDGILRIERRDGSVREIPEADLLAARLVGTPPTRRP
jgi:N-acetylglutamate synthase